MAAAFIEYIIAIYYFLFAIILVSYAFTTFLFVVQLTEDTTDMANSINSSAANTDDPLQTRKQLADFIRIYSITKQLNSYTSISFKTINSNPIKLLTLFVD